MRYGQITYPNTMQGIPPTRYTIAQIGCFLTAFCNLCSANGREISPLKLNDFFRAKGIYIDADDGIRDDLYWQAITKYWPALVVSGVSTGKKPPNTNAIVKLKARNTFGTHFCKVYKIIGGNVQIIDSWDGNIKNSSAYGGILGFATYQLNGADKPKPTPKTYTVKKSDSDGLVATMQRIGRGNQWAQVAKLNNLRQPYVIRPGQILKLP